MEVIFDYVLIFVHQSNHWSIRIIHSMEIQSEVLFNPFSRGILIATKTTIRKWFSFRRFYWVLIPFIGGAHCNRQLYTHWKQ